VRIDPGPDGVFQFSGDVSLANLAAWQQHADEMLPANEDVVIDLSRLEIRGAAVLPLLMHLVRRADAGDSSVSFTDAPERLQQIAELSDMTEILGLR
jgi:ABC-type transporter Mla MlaB component